MESAPEKCGTELRSAGGVPGAVPFAIPKPVRS
jgi:hypothetical protein